MMQFVGGVVVGFYYGWEMALVVLACTPIIGVAGFLFYVTTTATS